MRRPGAPQPILWFLVDAVDVRPWTRPYALSGVAHAQSPAAHPDEPPTASQISRASGRP